MKWIRRRILAWSIAAATLLLVAGLVFSGALDSSSGEEEQPIFKVRRGPLVISVTESFSEMTPLTLAIALVTSTLSSSV